MLQSIRKRDAIYLISEDHFASLPEVRGINGSQPGAFRKVSLLTFISSH